VSVQLRRGLCAASVVGAMLALAPGALASTQTARSGSVSATFSYKGKAPNFSHLQLTIKRSGSVAYSKSVTSSLCGSLCWPASTSASHPSVQVMNIEGNGQPDVIVTLYSGGANCCFDVQVFSYDPGTTTYRKAERNFGDFGANIKDLGHNGKLEFQGANIAFKYEFTDGAASGEPIQILTFSGGKFHDVTKQYPKLVAKDAAGWLKAFNGNVQDGVGLIAAWAADEDLLGHSKQVSAYLQKEAKAGKLHSPIEPGGQQFIKHLMKFLHQLGYVT
jgi:hypothetical protein